MSKLLGVAMMVLVACHPEPAPATSSCHAAHDQLAAFYTAVAAEREASPVHAGLALAEATLGVSDAPLVTVAAAPADASTSDYLVIAPTGAIMVTPDGDARQVMAIDEPGLFATGKTRSLVIAISPKTPWRIVQALYQKLRIDPAERDRLRIGLAYGSADAFTGRTPPVVSGATTEAVDFLRIGDDVTREAKAHCPKLAGAMARISGATSASDALRAMAAGLPSCDCAANLAELESIPWLFRRRVTALVPVELASETPALPVADPDATFGDVVRANGSKPIELAVPPLPPPPPRPRP